MLLSTFGFRFWVSYCPRGHKLSTSLPYGKDLTSAETAHHLDKVIGRYFLLRTGFTHYTSLTKQF